MTRFLADEPVAAFAGGTAYQLGKFVRRRRGTAVAIAAVVAAVVGGAGVAVWYSIENAAARAAAEHSSYVANISAAAAALRVDDAAEARRRLALAPEQLRDWEWRHLKARTDVSEETLSYPYGEFWGGAATADGSLLAIAATDGFTGVAGVLRRDGEEVFRWGVSDNSTSVALTPDGHWFASGFKDGTLRLKDFRSGAERVVENAHAGPLIDAGFSRDATRLVTGGADGKAVLWSLPDLGRVRTFEGNADRVISVAFDPAGARVVTGCRDGTIRVFDAATGAATSVLSGHLASVESVAVSPDGARLVSGSRDRTVRLWDLATGRMLSVGTSHGSNVRRVAFGPSGTVYASASWDGTIRLWDAASGDETGILRGHGGAVSSIAFVDGGTKLVSFSWDRTIKRWDVRRTEVPTFRDVNDSVSGIAFDATGTRVAACCENGTVFVLDAADASLLWREHAGRRMYGVVFAHTAPDRYATRDHCNVWQPPCVEDALVGFANLLTFDPVALTACETRRTSFRTGPTDVVLVELAGRRDVRFHTTPSCVTSLDHDPGSGAIAVGGKDGLVVLWRDGREITAKAHANSVDRVLLDPTGKLLLTCSSDGIARVLRTSDLSGVVELRGHASAVRDGAFLPGGRRIVTVSRDQTVRIWDAATGENLLVLHGSGYPVECVAVSPDGTRIATGAGSADDAHSNVKIWAAPAGGW